MLDGEFEGFSETEGFVLGTELGISLGSIETLGAELGETETLGDEVGEELGTSLGTDDKLGRELGRSLGMALGCEEILGNELGISLGASLGMLLGALLALGAAVGAEISDANNGGLVSVDTARSPSPMVGSSTVDSSAVMVKRIEATGPPTLNKKSCSWSM